MKSTENTLSHPLITPEHLRRKAVIYIRQSTMEQVRHNVGSTDFQRAQVDLARDYGWPEHLIQVIDEDLGRSGSSTVARSGWQSMLDQMAANQVGQSSRQTYLDFLANCWILKLFVCSLRITKCC
jgi:hypothetical protein